MGDEDTCARLTGARLCLYERFLRKNPRHEGFSSGIPPVLQTKTARSASLRLSSTHPAGGKRARLIFTSVGSTFVANTTQVRVCLATCGCGANMRCAHSALLNADASRDDECESIRRLGSAELCLDKSIAAPNVHHIQARRLGPTGRFGGRSVYLLTGRDKRARTAATHCAGLHCRSSRWP